MRAAVVLAALVVLIAQVSNAKPPEGGGAFPGGRTAKADAGPIAEAWFADPTQRYRHFVLGARWEPETLVVRLRTGQELRLTLPADSVFEDREPRIADLAGDGQGMVAVVRSYLDRGAALALIGVRNSKLEIVAETPPTGRPNTWLSPAGIADFDNDGRLDIAYVQMPHVLGRLRLVTLRAGKLVELASTDDVSNHRIGSSHLSISAVADVNRDGVPDLIVPALDRRSLRVLSFRGGVKEIARVAAPGRIGDGTIEFELSTPKRAITVRLEDGRPHRVQID